ncbi:MAG: imidazole glycerol phosphate synthase subunit HisH [Flavobacteriaceae bacterium]|nr:imidazole glycerol phosphate synthase subunit HisH [Flavobacteriaceae bacterium]|tara:strand:+ start:13517 stop:14098 length:582 start_codon:yes stop_codon:yes gene_type:complete
MNVAIIDYDAGNVQSLKFALDKLGVDSILTKDREFISKSDKVIFPGQGAAKNAMNKLYINDLVDLIPKLKQPVLGICLGMQLLFEKTEEGNVNGLGIIKGYVKKFSEKVKVPQMGWNTLENLESKLFNNINEGEYMYLVHSYYVPIVPETIGISEYDLKYSIAVKKNNFYGVQFHPEKSSFSGNKLLNNFLKL